MLKINKISKPELKKPILPFIILIIIIIIGTIGYDIIWKEYNSSLIDDLYMTFITITTIGYEEVYKLDTAGRLFTILIGIFGVGSLFYILSVLMENLVILQLSNYRGNKKMQKKIDNLKNHIIVVGLGRVGVLACNQLVKKNQKFVVVDDKVDELNFPFDNDQGYFLKGDATEDDTLISAGINNAKGMIVATANAATTVFVVLSAKVLKPNIFIVARSDDESSIEKLMRAGANRVVNPYSIGGQRLANLMVDTHIVDFFDTSFSAGNKSFGIERVEISPKSELDGKTLLESDLRKKSGATILAIIRDGDTIQNPDAQFKLQARDQLLSFGNLDNLHKLEELAG